VSAPRRADGPGDGRPLRSDDRALRRELRARAAVERQAYETGLAGVDWEPGTWPEGADVRAAYDAGCGDRRRDRRARRWGLALGALRWMGRQVAPATARRIRRARRQYRKLRGVRR